MPLLSPPVKSAPGPPPPRAAPAAIIVKVAPPVLPADAEENPWTDMTRSSYGPPPVPVDRREKAGPPKLSEAFAPPIRVAGRWKTKFEAVDLTGVNAPWHSTAAASDVPQHILKSAPKSPPRRLLDVKHEDVEMSEPLATPLTPRFLPDAPDIPDAITELTEEEKRCVYVFSEQLRASIAQQPRDTSDFDVYHMSTEGAVASQEGPSLDVPPIEVPLPRERLAADAPRVMPNLVCKCTA
jgi:hypothetical protein